MTKFLICLICLVSFSANAFVWEDSNQWSHQYELKYSKWIKSNLTKRFFYKKGTLLYKFRTDCADLLYALRVQFSFENQLPFAMRHPHNKGLLTNNTDQFDSILNKKRRVLAFIEYISQEAGTLNLRNDTFPVDIYDLREGDIYATKWSFLGESARHSSIIVKINSRNGYINLFSSDAPRKVRKLIYSQGTPDFEFKSKPWGYARWKWPSEYNIPNNLIDSDRGYSEMEYRLLRKYGSYDVHQKFQDIIKAR